MCKTYNKLPSDDWFEEIDEFEWLWMFYSWLEDQHELHEMYHDYGTFIGSFSNGEMAKKVWNLKNPSFASTDEEFEQSWGNIVDDVNKTDENYSKHRRHRKRKVLNTPGE